MAIPLFRQRQTAKFPKSRISRYSLQSCVVAFLGSSDINNTIPFQTNSKSNIDSAKLAPFHPKPCYYKVNRLVYSSFDLAILRFTILTLHQLPPAVIELSIGSNSDRNTSPDGYEHTIYEYYTLLIHNIY